MKSILYIYFLRTRITYYFCHLFRVRICIHKLIAVVVFTLNLILYIINTLHLLLWIMLYTLWLKAIFTKYIPTLFAVMKPELRMYFIAAIIAFEKFPLDFPRVFRINNRALNIKKNIINPFHRMILHAYNFLFV